MRIQGKRKFIIYVILFINIILLKLLSNTANRQITADNSNNLYYPAIVSKIIDGDTIDVFFVDNKPDFCNIEERVRLIGVDTPELNIHKKENPQYYSEEAKNFTSHELLEENILIRLDNVTNSRDKYGRLLAYVYIEDYLFNKILIEQGFGKYYKNFKFEKEMMNLFEKAQNYAKENKNGLWN